jgi:D-alanyl-D-alanine carboxypeptidase
VGQDVTNIADPSGSWAAGAVVATPSDLLRWVRTLYATDQVLDEATRMELTTPSKSQPYGLGVEIVSPRQTLGAGPALGHGGDIFGFHSDAFYFPKREMALVAIVNQDSVSQNDLMAAVLPVLVKH